MREVSAIQDSSKAIYFDGSFELELAPEVKEVLERGVPLNFNLEVEIFKIAGIGLTVRSVRSLKEFVSVITRRPVSIVVSLRGMTQNFDNLDRAIFFMTTISKLYVAPYRDINSDDYEVRSPFLFDTERLPKPFPGNASRKMTDGI